MYVFKKTILYSGAGFRQTKCIVMMTKEGITKIVNFITLGAGVLVLGLGHVSHKVKMNYVFKSLLLYTQALTRQTKYTVMMTKEESTKTVNFITPGAEVLVLWHGHIVKLQYFFSSSCLCWITDQTKGRVDKICKFHDPSAKVLILSCVIVIIGNMYYLLFYQYSKLIAIVLYGYGIASYVIVDFI